MNQSDLFYVFLFEVGAVDFFTKLTKEEIEANKDYNEVYWAHKASTTIHGPFKTVYEGMVNYTEVLASERKPVKEEVIAPVIYVDFTTKQRLVHG